MTRTLPLRDLAAAAALLLIVGLVSGPLLQLFDFGAMPKAGDMSSGDYPAFWLAERAIAEGRAAGLYDREIFRDLMVSAFGPEYSAGRWLYPPHFLLLLAPLSALPYAAGWLAMMASTFCAFVWAAARSYAGQPRVLMLSLVAPAVIVNEILGQTGFLASALLLGGLAMRAERPVLSGALIGLLTIKPHLGLLLPLILLFERRWLVIGVAAGVAIAAAGLSALAFGFELWPAFLKEMIGGDQKSMLDFVAGDLGSQMASLYGLARSLGIGNGPALGMQALCAVGAAYGAWRLSRSDMPVQTKTAGYVALCYLVSPYLMIYDLPALAASAVAVAVSREALADRALRTAAWAVYALPIIQIVTGTVLVPVGALCLIAFAVLMDPMRGRIGQLRPEV